MRIDSLDYLRGGMAVSVMLFHYTSWSIGGVESGSLLGKLGIYAVSIFYILSGLSLSFVYFSLDRAFSIREFILKRIFRIVPLFWLCLTLALLMKVVNGFLITGEGFQVDWLGVFLNYTLLFGFVMPDVYFSVGAWSIGNEVVFYAIFPFIIGSVIKYGKVVIYIWCALSFLLYCYFAFNFVDRDASLASNWATYVNPLNQVFLFVLGIALALLVKPYKQRLFTSTPKYIVGIILVLSVFALWPVESGDIELVTGLNRLVLTLLSLAIVYYFYVYPFKVNGLAGRFLSFLGECCYSIYLLHPIISFPVVYVLNLHFGFSLVFSYFCSVGFTLIACYISFNYIESPMIDLGKKIAGGKVGDANLQLSKAPGK